MALDYTNLYPDTSGNGGYTKSWNYTTLDSLATVAASGYFNKVSSRLGIGDNIIVAVVDAYDKTRTTLVEYGTLYVNGNAGGIVTTTSTSSSSTLPNPSPTTLGGVKSAAPVTSQWINSISTLGVPALSQPAFTDISGSVAAAQIPNPSASTLGGVQSAAAVSHNWISSISTSGVPTLSQPAFTDISGSVAATQMPAHTGDVTTVAGAVVTTIAANAVTNAKAAQMAAFTLKGNATGSLANSSDIDIAALTTKVSPAAGDYVIISDQAASGALKKASVSSVGSAGSVSSIAGNTGAFTLGTGLTNSTNDIRVSLPTASNVLGANVALNNTGTYFDGPSMAQGTSGTWFVSGTVTLFSSTASDEIEVKLWDGTTIIASASVNIAAASAKTVVTLSGFLATPAANIRISCKDGGSTNGSIIFNASGSSKDSSIFGVRIAP